MMDGRGSHSGVDTARSAGGVGSFHRRIHNFRSSHLTIHQFIHSFHLIFSHSIYLFINFFFSPSILYFISHFIMFFGIIIISIFIFPISYSLTPLLSVSFLPTIFISLVTIVYGYGYLEDFPPCSLFKSETLSICRRVQLFQYACRLLSPRYQEHFSIACALFIPRSRCPVYMPPPKPCYIELLCNK